jgi:hypothetical protein
MKISFRKNCMGRKEGSFRDTVIWSDETLVRQRPNSQEMRIRVQGSTSIHEENINPKVHSGGFGVMFWGCFSKFCLGPIVALEGTMKGSDYVNLLKERFSGRPMVFMQDHAPCHKARVVTDSPAENNILASSVVTRYESN